MAAQGCGPHAHDCYLAQRSVVWFPAAAIRGDAAAAPWPHGERGSTPPPPWAPPPATAQGAGVVGRDQAELYGGRVGLIHNTLADRLLDMADVVVTVGYVSGERGRCGCAVAALWLCSLRCGGPCPSACRALQLPAMGAGAVANWGAGGGMPCGSSERPARPVTCRSRIGACPQTRSYPILFEIQC